MSNLLVLTPGTDRLTIVGGILLASDHRLRVEE